MRALEEQLKEGTISIEELIAMRDPALLRKIPRFVLRYLKRILHLDEVNQVIQQHKGEGAVEFSEHILQDFETTYRVYGEASLRPGGRYILASNHPLGGFDGVVLMAYFGRVFPKIYFPVNDFLTELPQFSDVFLPINKLGRQSREGVARLEAALESDAQILYFPAGLCSRKGRGGIFDLEWKSSFIDMAKRWHRDVVPIYFEGRNSNCFYNLARGRVRLGVKFNVEMLYLVHEFFKQRGSHLRLQLGTPIPYTTFEDTQRSPREWAAWVRERAYALADELPAKERAR